MKNALVVFIKWVVYLIIILFLIVVIVGSVVTFWPCDPYVCSTSIQDIWESGVWWTFGILAHFLSSVEGVLLLCLIVIFVYHFVQFLHYILQKWLIKFCKRKKS